MPTKQFFTSYKIALSLLLIFLSDAFLYGQFTNIKVNSRNNSPNEVSITINPLNPLNIAAGANIASYYYSTDGGKSWHDSTLYSPLLGVWGDPSLCFDAAGNLFFAHLSNPTQGGYWIDRIVVQKSIDGGKSFDNGAGIGYNPPGRQQDKEWITADNSGSIFRNNLYMSWTEFDNYGSADPKDSSRIRFSRSTDNGLSWSAPLVISDSSGDCLDSDNTVEGAVPAIGPNGEVYISWSGPGGIRFDKSSDGGKTFGKDRFVTNQPGGWDFSISGIFRANGLPVTLCDISNSQYRGTVYINWSDQRYGYSDVFLIKSTDGGNSWSEVKKVNSSSGRDRFFTWATVDQHTGHLWIVYYDRSETADSATDVFVSKSTDGGETFSSFRISQSSFTPTSKVFFGDYINIAAFDGIIHPIWMRLDGKTLSIWTVIIEESTTGLPEEKYKSGLNYKLDQNYPNPFNPSTNISYSIASEGFVRLNVYNSLGQQVTTLVNGIQKAGSYTVSFGADYLPSGLYLYKLTSGIFSASNKMLLIK